MKINTSYKKPTGIYFLLEILSAILYTACNSSNNNINSNSINNPAAEQKISLVKLLLGNGNNLFRSVELGTDFKTVLGAEKKNS